LLLEARNVEQRCHDVFDGGFDGGAFDEEANGALVFEFGGLGGVAFFDGAGGLVADAFVGVGVGGGFCLGGLAGGLRGGVLAAVCCVAGWRGRRGWRGGGL
jgi:hypothetical protein